MALGRAERWISENVCQKGIIDLQQKPCVNNGPIFSGKRRADGVKEFLR